MLTSDEDINEKHLGAHILFPSPLRKKIKII